MFARRIVLALLAVLLPLHAQAQLDDLLAPLTPQEEKKAAEPKAKKRRSAKKPPPKKKSATPEFELTPLVEEKVELLVKVVGPDDALVLLDDERIRAGKALEVEPGEYTLTVRRLGYVEVRKYIRVKDSGLTKVSAVLDAVAGVLAVSADVPGAKVFVDGEAVGEAPLKGLLLDPGMHDVVIRREGFEDHASRIAVRAGRDYTVAGKLRPLDGNARMLLAENGDRPERTDLTPRPSRLDEGISFEQPPEVDSEPLYKKWYVWAGAGAVVVAAVTSAVLVSQNQNASGGLRPDDVCGGPCDGVINAPGIVRF